MEKSSNAKGILSCIETSIQYIKLILNSVEELAKQDHDYSSDSMLQIKKIIVGMKKIYDDLISVPITLDHSYDIIKDIIAHVHQSRSQLKGAVDGLIKQTGEQISKVSDATEIAASKILDVSEALTDKQNNLISRLDELAQNNESFAEFVDELKDDIYSQQDDTFMILDYLQFQDITSQQLEGAFGMLHQIEDRLLAVARLLEGLDDITFDTLQQRNKAYDQNAEFRDQSDTQKHIDELFKVNNNIAVDSNKEGVEENQVTDIEQNVEENNAKISSVSQEEIDNLMKSQDKPSVEQKVSNDKANQDDIDKLFAQNKPKPKTSSVSQEEIDKLMRSQSTQAVEQKVVDEKANQDDIDKLFAQNKPKSKTAPISQEEIDKLMRSQSTQAVEQKVVNEKANQDDIDKLFAQNSKSKEPNTSFSQDDIDKLFKTQK